MNRICRIAAALGRLRTALLLISGAALAASLAGWAPLGLDPAWIAALLCGAPIVAEAYSEHPLAQALVRGWHARFGEDPLPGVTAFRMVPGRGTAAVWVAADGACLGRIELRAAPSATPSRAAAPAGYARAVSTVYAQTSSDVGLQCP